MEKRITLVDLPPSQWEKYKELRLQALKTDPEAFGSSYDEEILDSDNNWKTKLKSSLNTRIFAKYNGRLIGMAGVRRTETLRQKHIAYLVGVYVCPEFRGKGIGKRLMERLLEKLRADNTLIKVQLWVSTKQISAINLYTSVGFKIAGELEKEIKINDKFYNDFIMEKIIR